MTAVAAPNQFAPKYAQFDSNCLHCFEWRKKKTHQLQQIIKQTIYVCCYCVNLVNPVDNRVKLLQKERQQ